MIIINSRGVHPPKSMMHIVYSQWRRPGAEFKGDGKICRGPRFLNDVFSGKISIFTPKISDDLFLVIDQVFFRDFTFLYCIKCRIRPFLHKKSHYFQKKNSLIRPSFTLFVLSPASDNTASLNIGGTNAWAVLHLKLGGGGVPQSP